MSLAYSPEAANYHLNIENFTTLTHPQYQLVAVLLMVGYGAHLAFSVFFLASSTQIAPRYRLVPWMSAVVMLAAGLSLFREFAVFEDSFTWVGGAWAPVQDRVFSNAYRYANWTITIPLLLGQLLIAIGLPQGTVHKRFMLLTAAAIAMIWTGLIGQFFEHTSVVTMLVWGFVSTIPFAYLVWGVWKALRLSREHTPAVLHEWTNNFFYYFLFFWGLYAIAYMVPAFADGGGAVVVRQVLYTIADVFSKLVYGLILARFVLRRSALDGYEPAIKSLETWPHLIGGAARTVDRDETGTAKGA